MSETAGAENVIPPAGNEPTQQADNPAWSDFLSNVPESMHDMFKPHLAKWDEGINSRIQQVHTEYADYRPFKDAGINRETLEQAWGIYEAINNDPRKVYDILAESYNFNAPQQQAIQQQPLNAPQQQGNQQPENFEYDIGQGGQFDPKIQHLEQTVQTMAQILLAERQQAEAKQAASELDSELAAAKAKHGDFDERVVLGYVQSGMTVDKAAEAYAAWRNEILSSHNRPTAPTVISGSGALPSQQINPAALNQKDTRSLVAEMMKAANQQR